MTQRITLLTAACVLGATAVLAGCAVSPGASDLDQLTARIFQKSFRDEGIVKVAAMAQDDATRECSAADVAGKPLDEKRAKEIEAANLKTIQWPADGRFLGDWQKGEALAQSGRGLTFTDTAQTPNGGNCYNCHQLSHQGNLLWHHRPSLYNYGKIARCHRSRQPSSPNPSWNTPGARSGMPSAYNACSNMPRFAGHKGILTERKCAT
jgi:sulfur-oxidizing protein SoxX